MRSVCHLTDPRSSDVLYDCMHYALHHSRLPEYMRKMKKYHLAHHYKNFELGFGVTSECFHLQLGSMSDFVVTGKIWDVVFNTVLPV
jgi:4-hydroxysphinganine ceramide fatty acyl 2-hydroxylase